MKEKTAEEHLEEAMQRFKPVNEDDGQTIQTKAGPLWFKLYENWIAARFPDVERAKVYFGVGDGDFNSRLNPYSGKWNWHSSRASAETKAEKLAVIKEAIDCFVREVARIS